MNPDPRATAGRKDPTEHSRLLATQGRIIELLKVLIDDQTNSPALVGEIQGHVRDMRETMNNISTP